MTSIEWYFAELSKGTVMDENQGDEVDYKLYNNFINLYERISKQLLNYLETHADDFDDDGILLSNFIDDISSKISKTKDSILGFITKYEMRGWYEDYINIPKEYKKTFWKEMLLITGKETLQNERRILKQYEIILDMLLYLRTQWIKAHHSNINNKYIICDEKIVTWLFSHNRVLELRQSFLQD